MAQTRSHATVTPGPGRTEAVHGGSLIGSPAPTDRQLGSISRVRTPPLGRLSFFPGQSDRFPWTIDFVASICAPGSPEHGPIVRPSLPSRENLDDDVSKPLQLCAITEKSVAAMLDRGGQMK